MTGPLKHPKQEKFCQEILKGKSVGDAYAAAGYKRNDKNAARLKKNEGVAIRLTELQSRVAEKAVITAHDIAAQLDEDRKFARDLKSASAAVSATMGKAKVLGLVTTQLSGPGGGPIEYRDLSEEEVEARIAAHEAARAARKAG